MMKRSLLLGICLALVVAAGCSENEPVLLPEKHADATLILPGEPIDAAYITSEDWVRENYSHSYTVGWSNFGDEAYIGFGDCYGWVGDELAVTKELFVNDSGPIDITINGCPVGTTWSVFHCDLTDLQIEKVDSVRAPHYSYNISWRCTINEPGKGFISFSGVPPLYIGAKRQSLGIMYTHGFIDTIRVAIESITWHYSIAEKTSDLSVALKGSTNAQQLLIETYGDGIRWIKNIPLDSDGSFSKEYWLAFIYEGDKFLEHDAKLFVIGTVGMPRVIHLKNPLGASPDARLIP